MFNSVHFRWEEPGSPGFDPQPMNRMAALANMLVAWCLYSFTVYSRLGSWPPPPFWFDGTGVGARGVVPTEAEDMVGVPAMSMGLVDKWYTQSTEDTGHML